MSRQGDVMGTPATSDRFALVLALTRQVTSRHDLDDVLSATLQCLRPLVQFGGGSIQLLDEEGWIQMAAADPVAPPHVMAQRVPLGTSVAGGLVLAQEAGFFQGLPQEGRPGGGRPGGGTRGRRHFWRTPPAA